MFNFIGIRHFETVIMITTGIKAEILGQVQGKLKCSVIVPSIHFSHEEWIKKKQEVLSKIKKKFEGKALIVRSSAQKEDSDN